MEREKRKIHKNKKREKKKINGETTEFRLEREQLHNGVKCEIRH